ncbi:hypothetical protein HHK36_020301 [Tetracentron sinense]|uniref:F-box domain-containing protein n=1 Tax=Tetracentron sinense TaxID=13715 RepID=A0A835D8Q1_TETSI|nr:hypothetical protein HHK36_020301 [Tetracentron sinense]
MAHMKKRKQVDDKKAVGKVGKKSNREKNKNVVVSQESLYICKEEIPYLSEEIIHNILAELPFDSLLNSRLVCKLWSNIISNPFVTYSSLLQSEPGLIIQQKKMSKEAHFKTYFMAMQDEQITVREFSIPCIGNIYYSCNGLVLLEGKQDNLCIANFVTKQQVTLPCHTLLDVFSISLGFAFVPSRGEYKVVHLYENDDGEQYLRFEILTLGSDKWRHVDLPPFALRFHLGMGDIPISVKGFLHWYSSPLDSMDSILSMDVCDEKIYNTSLPSCSGQVELLNIGGFLSLLSKDFLKLTLSIWVLKDSYKGIWVNQLQIDLGGMLRLYTLRTVGFLSLKNGKVIILRRHCNKSESCYYAYDIEHHRMWQVAINIKNERRYAMTHVNSLISWETIQ